MRSNALYSGADLSKKKEGGALFLTSYERAAKIRHKKKQTAMIDSISKILSIKAPVRGCLQLQNFAQTLMTHILMQKNTWRNIWRILRIGDSD